MQAQKRDRLVEATTTVVVRMSHVTSSRCWTLLGFTRPYWRAAACRRAYKGQSSSSLRLLSLAPELYYESFAVCQMGESTLAHAGITSCAGVKIFAFRGLVWRASAIADVIPVASNMLPSGLSHCPISLLDNCFPYRRGYSYLKSHLMLDALNC